MLSESSTTRTAVGATDGQHRERNAGTELAALLSWAAAAAAAAARWCCWRGRRRRAAAPAAARPPPRRGARSRGADRSPHRGRLDDHAGRRAHRANPAGGATPCAAGSTETGTTIDDRRVAPPSATCTPRRRRRPPRRLASRHRCSRPRSCSTHLSRPATSTPPAPGRAVGPDDTAPASTSTPRPPVRPSRVGPTSSSPATASGRSRHAGSDRARTARSIDEGWRAHLRRRTASRSVTTRT